MKTVSSFCFFILLFITGTAVAGPSSTPDPAEETDQERASTPLSQSTVIIYSDDESEEESARALQTRAFSHHQQSFSTAASDSTNEAKEVVVVVQTVNNNGSERWEQKGRRHNIEDDDASLNKPHPPPPTLLRTSSVPHLLHTTDFWYHLQRVGAWQILFGGACHIFLPTYAIPGDIVAILGLIEMGVVYLHNYFHRHR